MFDTTFTYSSSIELPPALDTADAVKELHNFEDILKLSPDCRGCKPIPPPQGSQPKNSTANTNGASPQINYYEVEDDIAFIPKKLWSGGVKYQADCVALDNGCDITVHAPGGFTSTNHWRIVRDTVSDDREHGDALEKVVSRDMHHAESARHVGWYVQIVSDAKCPRPYAGFVKGFLKNSHAQLEHAFIDSFHVPVDVEPEMPQVQRLSIVDEDAEQPQRPPMPAKRPTRPGLSRRRSSVL